MSMRWKMIAEVDVIIKDIEFDVNNPFDGGRLIAVYVRMKDDRSLLLKGRLIPDRLADEFSVDKEAHDDIETYDERVDALCKIVREQDQKILALELERESLRYRVNAQQKLLLERSKMTFQEWTVRTDETQSLRAKMVVPPCIIPFGGDAGRKPDVASVKSYEVKPTYDVAGAGTVDSWLKSGQIEPDQAMIIEPDDE